MSNRLIGDAVKIKPDRGDDHDRQQEVDGDAVLLPGQRQRHTIDRDRQQDVQRELAHDFPGIECIAACDDVEAKRDDAHAERERRSARHLAGGERCVGQRAEGDEFALRDQDDARHREHKNEREAEQRIDRAACYSVLQQEQKNCTVQDIPLTTFPPQAAEDGAWDSGGRGGR